MDLNGAAARNTGIFYSKSKYIAFLDDDDEYLRKKLELQIKLLEKLDDTWGGVYCGYSKYKRGKLLYKWLNASQGDLKKQVFLMENTIGGCSTLLIKRSILNELNGFDVEFSRHQDWEILSRFFRKYKLAYVNQILVKRHLDDRKNVPDIKEFIEIKARFLNKFKEDIKKMQTSMQREIFKRHYLEIARFSLLQGKFKEGKKYYEKSRMYSTLNLFDYLKLIISLLDFLFSIRYYMRELMMKHFAFLNFDKFLKKFNR
ncbi:MAG: glycosyltransferase [Candidatus Lokiarchaeota archaeon]